DILISELNNNFKKISAFVDNGIATKSDLDVVRVEILKVGQRREELKMTSSTYREMLASLTGLEEVKEGDLIKPRVDLNALTGKINRPELGLFEAQMRLLTSQESGIKASTMPRLNLFLQGGYGNPGLNMLKNEFSTFYIGGVRLVWNFGSLYTRGNSLKKLESGRESIRVQRETFLFNNNLAENQQRNEVEKLAKQLASDDEIIAIRERIKKAAEKKVEEGTISVSDLVREINAESMARQERSTHEIMHLMAIYSIKYLKNN
ncbi:MAG: TolC family protein, partial [Bacteroidales bacterium]|nr:TolC family protein [Bacteroidales bacterium]